MLNISETPDFAALERCVNEIDAFIDTLGRYPQSVLAFALRVHLSALLRAMTEDHGGTREEVRQFVVELEREALGVGKE